MTIGEIEVLPPIVISDVVWASTNMVTDGVPDGVIDRRNAIDAKALAAEQTVNRVGVFRRRGTLRQGRTIGRPRRLQCKRASGRSPR